MQTGRGFVCSTTSSHYQRKWRTLAQCCPFLEVGRKAIHVKQPYQNHIINSNLSRWLFQFTRHPIEVQISWCTITQRAWHDHLRSFWYQNFFWQHYSDCFFLLMVEYNLPVVDLENNNFLGLPFAVFLPKKIIPVGLCNFELGSCSDSSSSWPWIPMHEPVHAPDDPNRPSENA